MPVLPADEENGLTTHRVEALQDGVFAIVMTLLVLDLKVPDVHGGAALASALWSQWPIIFSYVVTFINLGVYWVGQHNQFYYIRMTDRILLWLNIIFLMFISLLPFTTALLGKYGGEQLPSVLYGLNLIAIGLIGYWHWCYATMHHRLTTHDVSETIIRSVKKRILFGPLICLLAIAASFFQTTLSLCFYLLLPLFFMRPGKVDGVWRRAAVPHEH